MTTEIYKGWTIEVATAGQIAIIASDESTKEAYLSQMTGGKRSASHCSSKMASGFWID